MSDGIYKFSDKASKSGSFAPSTSMLTPSAPTIAYKDTKFWSIFCCLSVVGCTCIGLVCYWVTYYEGYGWKDAKKQFNWHPIFMVLFLFFYGQAILVYRVFSFLPKLTLKLLHFCFHSLGLLSASFALVAVFENHRKLGYADLYSLHSWIGICTVGLFSLQYVSSFVTFLFPGLKASLKALIMPWHVFLGLGIFTMGLGAAVSGLTERLIWTPNYSSFVTPGILGNCLGIGLIAFGLLVVYLATQSEYKLQSVQNEAYSHRSYRHEDPVPAYNPEVAS